MSRGEPSLLLDEHIPLAVAEGLRNLGVEEKAGREEPVQPVFEWLRSPRTERGGGRVREARPSYARALERVERPIPVES